jgi:hypothetical protein
VTPSDPKQRVIIASTHADDGDEPYAPSCDLWMDISNDGTPTYWVSGGDPSGVRVSAETWRDVARLKSAAELRQLRQMLQEALDGTVEGTVAHTISLIAARVA